MKNLALLLFYFLFIQSAFLQNSNYWQQRAEYEMKIDIDSKKHTYVGKAEIKYFNNSPDTLNKIYFHLFWNAFQPGSSMDYRLQNIEDPDQRMVTDSNLSKISQLKENQIGKQDIQHIKINGKFQKFLIDETIMVVFLDNPIAPNSSVKIALDWNSQIPKMIRRAGRNNPEGIDYSMAQWYPKICQYDKEGWHTYEYIGREFYGVFSDYNIEITMDSKYVIGGSGKLLNPEECKGYSSKKISKKEKTTWKFEAKNIHDFAFAADPEFKVSKMKISDTQDLFLVKKDDSRNKEMWDSIKPLLPKLFNSYKEKVGAYPYKTYTIVQGGDGGMEYGQTTLVLTNGTDLKGKLGLLVHEIGHTWFQQIIATNEAQHAWMDEGFTSYLEELIMEDLLNEKSTNKFSDYYKYYNYISQKGLEEPMDSWADHFDLNFGYSVSSYYKGAIFLNQLGYIIGNENLEKTLKQYFEKWKFKHPSPKDFIRVAEKVSDMDLGWYLYYFSRTTNFIDYSVKKLKDRSFEFERIGNHPMPLDFYVEYEDGTFENFYIPLKMMRFLPKDKRKTFKKDEKEYRLIPSWPWTNPIYQIEFPKTPKRIEIDPSKRMVDIDESNNIYNK